MAKEAERLLSGRGWLPEPLRPILDATSDDGATGEVDGDVALPDFLAGDEDENPAEDQEEAQHITAE
ncbi:hypothetical protein [Paracoccus aminovorans]|uniref:hypothetical protein n=1 Tax=Paracoccus aminovorans TaxID=34004 RepID=UPI00396F6FFB